MGGLGGRETATWTGEDEDRLLEEAASGEADVGRREERMFTARDKRKMVEAMEKVMATLS